MIERIMDLNRSARREFLLSFNERELNDYLTQLESLHTRPALSAAICDYESELDFDRN
jgi:hypothetical protein